MLVLCSRCSCSSHPSRTHFVLHSLIPCSTALFLAFSLLILPQMDGFCVNACFAQMEGTAELGAREPSWEEAGG